MTPMKSFNERIKIATKCKNGEINYLNVFINLSPLPLSTCCWCCYLQRDFCRLQLLYLPWYSRLMPVSCWCLYTTYIKSQFMFLIHLEIFNKRCFTLDLFKPCLVLYVSTKPRDNITINRSYLWDNRFDWVQL